MPSALGMGPQCSNLSADMPQLPLPRRDMLPGGKVLQPDNRVQAQAAPLRGLVHLTIPEVKLHSTPPLVTTTLPALQGNEKICATFSCHGGDCFKGQKAVAMCPEGLDFCEGLLGNVVIVPDPGAVVSLAPCGDSSGGSVHSAGASMDQSVAIQETLAEGEYCVIISFLC
ncbi:hypothetical protein AAY473_026756 [Plecturocebus cupreus]